MEHVQLREAYANVRRACRDDWRSDAVSRAILDLAVTSLQFLAAECDQIALNSLVPGKNYISFLRNRIVARPANRDLFLLEPERIVQEWHAWMRNRPDIHDVGRIFYTVAAGTVPCNGIVRPQQQERASHVFRVHDWALFCEIAWH